MQLMTMLEKQILLWATDGKLGERGGRRFYNDFGSINCQWLQESCLKIIFSARKQKY